MSFELSPELDSNKVFLVKRSELEGRLDTVFYQPKYMANEEAIKSSKWGYDKVSHIAQRIADGPFGSDLKVDEYQPEGNPLLRVSNIRTGEVEGDLVYISDEKQNQLKRSKVYPNDVLLTKAGAILGYSAVFPESMKEGNITSHLVTITCRDDIDPHYLSHFFRSNIGQLQIYRWGNKSTRPELNTGEVESILVTTPPPHIQAEIVKSLNAAYNAKKQKEAEAQQLLDSIDDYLLDELGFELPEQKENTIQNRMFTRRLSEVSGGRFDPNYNLNIELITGRRAKYEFVNLKDILRHPPQYGANEPAVDGIRGSGTRYIRITDISEIGELKNNSWKTAEVLEDQYLLNYNDLLFARSGSVGRAYLHKNTSEKAIYAGYLIRFFLNDKLVDPDYIFFYCHSIIYKLWVNAVYRPAVQANINAEEYKSLPIVLPPMDKQTEIANHIKNIRNQAKALQQQAKADLEQAKKEVEAMILGEDENMA